MIDSASAVGSGLPWGWEHVCRRPYCLPRHPRPHPLLITVLCTPSPLLRTAFGVVHANPRFRSRHVTRTWPIRGLHSSSHCDP